MGTKKVAKQRVLDSIIYFNIAALCVAVIMFIIFQKSAYITDNDYYTLFSFVTYLMFILGVVTIVFFGSVTTLSACFSRCGCGCCLIFLAVIYIIICCATMVIIQYIFEMLNNVRAYSDLSDPEVNRFAHELREQIITFSEEDPEIKDIYTNTTELIDCCGFLDQNDSLVGFIILFFVTIFFLVINIILSCFYTFLPDKIKTQKKQYIPYQNQSPSISLQAVNSPDDTASSRPSISSVSTTSHPTASLLSSTSYMATPSYVTTPSNSTNSHSPPFKPEEPCVIQYSDNSQNKFNVPKALHIQSKQQYYIQDPGIYIPQFHENQHRHS
ncbi:hypothetical protein WA158_005036 [Blastocystis sp. Blastoise]